MRAGTPLNFRNKQSRMFALALPADGADTSNSTWSPPITVNYPGIPELYLNIPVTGEWVSRNLLAPRTSVQRSGDGGSKSNLSRCSKSLLTSQQQVASKGDSVELRERTVAVLKMSMQVHSPGCVHVVLHSAGCQPPFLLQNRTHRDLKFRQHGTQDSWRLLPAFTALGFSWPYLTRALPSHLPC